MATFLFYLEPFPIRNSLTPFSFIPIRMAPALLGTQTDDQFYIFGNRETLTVIAKNKPEMISHFVCPTIDEGEWFRSLRCDWETEGITQWLELMRPSERTEQFITLLYSLFDRQPFDYIVC